MSAFDDWFAKHMPDAAKWFEELAAEPVTGRPRVEPMGDAAFAGSVAAWWDPTRNAEENANLIGSVTKLGGYIEVPDELLMAYGLIPDTRPPLPPTPWRWRAKQQIRAWREQAARAAYRVIAGYWPRDGEDDW